jgi:hypothetical protein
MGVRLNQTGGADGARRGDSVVSDLLKQFFQISMLIRKMTRVMAAGEVKVKCISAGLIWSSAFKQFTFVKLSVVFCPEALNGSVDALGVCPAKEFCQFSSPVHGVLLDFDHFGFFHRDHVIHGPDVASWFHCDCVS